MKNIIIKLIENERGFNGTLLGARVNINKEEGNPERAKGTVSIENGSLNITITNDNGEVYPEGVHSVRDIINIIKAIRVDEFIDEQTLPEYMEFDGSSITVRKYGNCFNRRLAIIHLNEEYGADTTFACALNRYEIATPIEFDRSEHTDPCERPPVVMVSTMLDPKEEGRTYYYTLKALQDGIHDLLFPY